MSGVLCGGTQLGWLHHQHRTSPPPTPSPTRVPVNASEEQICEDAVWLFLEIYKGGGGRGGGEKERKQKPSVLFK